MATPINNNTTSLQDLLAKANALPEAGTKLPALTTPGAAADLRSGKQLIDGDGNVVEGSMPTATQATPGITVSSGGLITASATQSAGYVAAGTKSATKQLTTQGAQTITPGTSNKTILSGRYLTGTQTIKGDSNLIAGNIKKGVSIFNVVGSYEGSGGSGGGSVEGYCRVGVLMPSNLTNMYYQNCYFIVELENGAERREFDTLSNGTAYNLDENSNVKRGSVIVLVLRNRASGETSVLDYNFSTSACECILKETGVAVFKITGGVDDHVSITISEGGPA